MNIKQAKEEIIHTVRAYLAKEEDSLGETAEYKVPVIRQRPILLMGPPGIGKTQIMEQIAQECRIGLVSYTITHHTRQSAVGLPFIKERQFQGKQYSVTEYTMSEIIASVYRKIEEGFLEGILFIDEINCVSETLAPTMLQFLQCKTFGNQEVPKGWIIVAAGNPPEYNKSVREFDMVTLDRVRVISVEADYKVWKEYARTTQMHSALLSYLDLRPKNFYRVEADVDGLQYVTARGWEDFSHLLCGYEEMELPISKEIVYEFLHHQDVAEDVAAYIDLYRKYQDDYGIDRILRGRVKPEVFARVYQAGFDERISVVNLLLDGLMGYFRTVSFEKNVTDGYFSFLKTWRKKLEQISEGDTAAFAGAKADACLELYQNQLEEWTILEKKSRDAKKTAAGEDSALYNDHKVLRRLLDLLKEGTPLEQAESGEPFERARAFFELQRQRLEEAEKEAGRALEYAFDFMEEAFSQGEEMVVFVTELTVSKEAAAFLSEYICERYLAYNRQLLIGSRKGELLSELNR
ncbi:MAG: AAA family ATPase [Lachnospiraceae bacterium]|nr:AAA family ATPase [Lachnospiraceae bacterium]